MRSAWAWIAIAGMMLHAPPLAAQGAGTTVGLVLGGGRTTQIWTPSASSEDVTGIVAGAFADAPTPVSGLSILAEGAYVQRGGDVTLDVAGQPAEGGLRGDYLSLAVHLKLTRSIGPLRAHVALGPTLDQVLRSRLDPVLAQVVDDDKAVVFSATIGGGVGAWVGERLFVGLDARHVEGIGDAHSGNFTRARNRSIEVLLRAGIPLDVLRGR